MTRTAFAAIACLLLAPSAWARPRKNGSAHAAAKSIAAAIDEEPGASDKATPPPAVAGPEVAATASGAIVDDWLTTPSQQPAALQRGPVGGALASLLLAAAALACGIRWHRGRNRSRDLHGGERIALLASRALGGKQRLALVEVCGERLLLASCDGELTLLSHLPGAPEEVRGGFVSGDQGASQPALAPRAISAQRGGPSVAAGLPSEGLHDAVATASALAAPACLTPAGEPTASQSASAAPDASFAGLLHRHVAPPPKMETAVGHGPPLSGDLAGLRAWRQQSSKPYEVRV